MPNLTIPFNISITPERFLQNCSPVELRELDILLQSAHYQKRMNGTYTPDANEKPIKNSEFKIQNL